MKMAKKLLAVVLTGVMALSMLTGCASIASRQAADELEGMLKAANTKATVKAVDDDLAKDAVNGAVKDHAFVTDVNAGVKAKLDTDKNNGMTLAGTEYKMSLATTGEKLGNVSVKQDYTIYVDAYGYMIYVEEVEEIGNYALILNIKGGTDW